MQIHIKVFRSLLFVSLLVISQLIFAESDDDLSAVGIIRAKSNIQAFGEVDWNDTIQVAISKWCAVDGIKTCKIYFESENAIDVKKKSAAQIVQTIESLALKLTEGPKRYPKEVLMEMRFQKYMAKNGKEYYLPQSSLTIVADSIILQGISHSFKVTYAMTPGAEVKFSENTLWSKKDFLIGVAGVIETATLEPKIPSSENDLLVFNLLKKKYPFAACFNEDNCDGSVIGPDGSSIAFAHGTITYRSPHSTEDLEKLYIKHLNEISAKNNKDQSGSL